MDSAICRPYLEIRLKQAGVQVCCKQPTPLDSPKAWNKKQRLTTKLLLLVLKVCIPCGVLGITAFVVGREKQSPVQMDYNI